MRALILSLTTCLLFLTGLHAAEFTVDSGADSHDVTPGDGVCGTGAAGSCTFRAAVEEANALSGADTILVSSPVSPVRLSLGPVTITDDRTFVLGDSASPIIDGFLNSYGQPSLILQSNSNAVQGIWYRRARGPALLITGHGNQIGGESDAGRVVLTANCIDNNQTGAVTIREGWHNRIQNCFVGVYGNGTVVEGNAFGVLIHDADSNHVGGLDSTIQNVIAGNRGPGVVVTTNSSGNTVAGNLIGVDASGIFAAPNGSGIVLSNGATENTIGGNSPGEANVISANNGDGVVLTGYGTSGNVLLGNVIGLDVSRFTALGNHGAGVRIRSAATENVIGGLEPGGRNLIGSNDLDGIVIEGSGTDNNVVAGNIIGLDKRGSRFRGNGRIEGNGITISRGARSNTIGSVDRRGSNVVSGQFSDGIVIEDPGTAFNSVIGNYIGTGIEGVFTAGNRNGVVIRNGASNNLVGGDETSQRNIISGNYGSPFPHGAGVQLLGEGTLNNTVAGNYIGTDTSGTRAIRNGNFGVIVGLGASNNRIGGAAHGEGNLISGNGFGELIESLAGGVHIYGEGTRGNRIEGNTIGLMSVEGQSLFNWGHGIGLFAGAAENTIGGNTAQAGNTIATHPWSGIHVADSTSVGNTFRFNRIFSNDSSEICITNGAQGSIQPPVIDHASILYITGSGASPGGTIDVYLASNDPDERGGAIRHVATSTVNGAGQFFVYPQSVSEGDTVTATITDLGGNTSEFSLNHVLLFETDAGPADEPGNLPRDFALYQNFPNPFNPAAEIRFALPHATLVEFEIFNVLGRRVRHFVPRKYPAGEFSVVWDGTDDSGRPVAGGVYFYRLTAGDFSAAKKMVLLK